MGVNEHCLLPPPLFPPPSLPALHSVHHTESKTLGLIYKYSFQPFWKLQLQQTLQRQRCPKDKSSVMFLLLLQMLLISCPAATAQRGEQQNQKRRRRPALLPHGRHLPMDYEEIRAKPSLFVAEPPAETESNKTVDETKISTFIFPYIEDGRPVQDLGSWTPAGEFPDSEDTASPPSHPHSKREVESPFRKDARRFWDLFMLKTKSRSEELVLPIKTNEMYQETCSSLPFSQVKLNLKIQSLPTASFFSNQSYSVKHSCWLIFMSKLHFLVAELHPHNNPVRYASPIVCRKVPLEKPYI